MPESPADGLDPRHPPYFHISGTVINSNTKHSTFEMQPTQYVSSLKSLRKRSMGPFPIKCTFMESARFRNKKLTPKDGSYVTIEGSLTNFAIAPNEDFPNHFNISIENITFLGRTMVLPPLTNTPGNTPGSST